jgi:FkbM family methyltransferase
MTARTHRVSTEYGDVATVLESPGELRTLFGEVEEYFECGATVSPGATVVDVGANIGAFAVAVARRCQHEARILCFEPVPMLFEALDRNLRENRWLAGGNHRAENVALSAPADSGVPCAFYYFRRFPRDSTMDLAGKRQEFEAFFAAQGARIGRSVAWLGPGSKLVERMIASLPRGALGHWLSDQVTGLERLSVPQRTLAEALNDQAVTRIDLLKIDVEGAEMKVLAGIDAPTWSKVSQLIVESDGAEAHTRALLAQIAAGGLDRVKIACPPSTAERGLPNVIIHACRTTH